eukprot:1275328-Rhodomonas_salina.1
MSPVTLSRYLSSTSSLEHRHRKTEPEAAPLVTRASKLAHGSRVSGYLTVSMACPVVALSTRTDPELAREMPFRLRTSDLSASCNTSPGPTENIPPKTTLRTRCVLQRHLDPFPSFSMVGAFQSSEQLRLLASICARSVSESQTTVAM